VAEIILGFALGYGVPMFLLKRYIARRRRETNAQQAQTVIDRAA
jgi:hypothetical protein